MFGCIYFAVQYLRPEFGCTYLVLFICFQGAIIVVRAIYSVSTYNIHTQLVSVHCPTIAGIGRRLC